MSIVEKVIGIIAMVGFCACYIFFLAWIIVAITKIFSRNSKEE